VTAVSDELVVLPMQTWSGNFATPNQQVTIIDLGELGNLVEFVCGKLIDLPNSDELEVILSGGVAELQARYLLLSPMKQL
jgi:hypothetical protein